jgi:hypothetical protein
MANFNFPLPGLYYPKGLGFRVAELTPSAWAARNLPSKSADALNRAVNKTLTFGTDYSSINEESKAETDRLWLGRGFDDRPGQAGHP